MEIKDFGRLQDHLAYIGAWLSRRRYFFKWKYLLPFIGALWLYLFLDHSIKGVIVISILAVIASYSTIYKRVVRIPSAIELVTLGTVVTSISYGPFAGAVFGVMTTIASEIISSAVDMFTLIYAFARGIIGVVAVYAFSIAGIDVVLLGILMVLLFNLICQPVYLLPGDVETRIRAAYFFFINILFNFVAFLFFGKFLLTVAA